VVANRSNRSKNEKKKIRAKSMKGVNLINYVGVRLQSGRIYTYIGSRT
jgi:hypothetical protein